MTFLQRWGSGGKGFARVALPAVMAISVSFSCRAPAPEADLILVGGNIWTVDDTKPTAQAVAVYGGRIVAVGSDDEIQRYAGDRTRVVELRGRLMLPGFIDNHVHFTSGGLQLLNVDLRSAKDEEEFVRRIAEWAKQHPEKWITGGEWDHDSWPGGTLPTKELVDPVAPNTPVFVSRYDGHMGLANSYALQIAGITRHTLDPPGGAIVRDRLTGEPTGILKDEAMALVWKHVPAPTQQESLEAVRLALGEARRVGVTSVQDISSPEEIVIYRILLQQDELTARMYCRLPLSRWQTLAQDGIHPWEGDEWIRTGSLKAFADGSLGSSTALFFEPYVSDSTTRGLASDILADGRLEEWCLAADRAQLQLSVHAIGDSANSHVLDIVERILNTNPPWDRRFRIEHAQHIHPRDFERFARFGVIAAVQPYHAIDDGRWAESRIGRERCATTYPFKSFLDNHILLSFGSDWTVGSLNPLLGIYAAVTRRTTDGKHPDGWFPEQKISVREAIKAYTINNAFAAFQQNDKGSITPGKVADLVVLSDDILTIDPVTIPEVTVEMTIVGGKIVHPR